MAAPRSEGVSAEVIESVGEAMNTPTAWGGMLLGAGALGGAQGGRRIGEFYGNIVAGVFGGLFSSMGSWNVSFPWSDVGLPDITPSPGGEKPQPRSVNPVLGTKTEDRNGSQPGQPGQPEFQPLVGVTAEHVRRAIRDIRNNAGPGKFPFSTPAAPRPGAIADVLKEGKSGIGIPGVGAFVAPDGRRDLLVQRIQAMPDFAATGVGTGTPAPAKAQAPAGVPTVGQLFPTGADPFPFSSSAAPGGSRSSTGSDSRHPLQPTDPLTGQPIQAPPFIIPLPTGSPARSSGKGAGFLDDILEAIFGGGSRAPSPASFS